MDDTQYLETQPSIWGLVFFHNLVILMKIKYHQNNYYNNIDYLKYNINDKVLLRPTPSKYKNGIASTWE